ACSAPDISVSQGRAASTLSPYCCTRCPLSHEREHSNPRLRPPLSRCARALLFRCAREVRKRFVPPETTRDMITLGRGLLFVPANTKETLMLLPHSLPARSLFVLRRRTRRLAGDGHHMCSTTTT
ncbi:unnamed protein product, partial [Ectocarpus sp. 8 AP-2014]